ncbi:hypothetical protein RB2150_10239 [Rhodobacterales bacterium HTCC2150]|nr:hypothetical protein RB2150_10239 [Rhodobacterales bacterium HTCC2150] [Rhodobacteraceae bacterium HTCC2150]
MKSLGVAGGSYRGGSTIIYTGNHKIDVMRPTGIKIKKKSAHAPGLHVLSKEDSKRVMRKVWKSREKSEAIARKKKADETAKRTNAFSKFLNDVKKLQNE